MKHSNLSKVNIKKVRKIVKKNKKQSKDRSTPLIIVDEGSDVVFNMNVDEGSWKGVRTSEMISDHDARRLLRWVLRNDFNEEAQEIIENQLREITFI